MSESEMLSSEASQQYKMEAIRTSSQLQLIMMLYDAGIRALDVVLQLQCDEKEKQFQKYEAFNKQVLLVQDIVTELRLALDLEKGGEVGEVLYDLYEYMNQRLISANVHKDFEPVREVREHLKALRETWRQIKGNDEEKSCKNFKHFDSTNTWELSI